MFAQHQYNSHTIIKLHETGLDTKITGHVVEFRELVPVDVQEQGNPFHQGIISKNISPSYV